MKKNWAVALAVSLSAAAVALALVLTGLWPMPQAAPAQPVDGSLNVKAGHAVLFPSTNGSPEVHIPGDAISGEGQLTVKLVQLPDSRSGWAIDLEGAQLTGQATLVFRGLVKDGQPAPLVGFNESPADELQYVLDSEVSGTDVIVRTTHFSNWLTVSWDWLTQWARDKLDSVYKSSGVGSQPKCEKEAEARAGDVVVSSDSGGAVQWCLGKQNDGSTVLKVNNSRGYAVAAERSPVLTIGQRNHDFGQIVPKLAKFITAPSKKGNVIDIIGPGETIEYKVETSGAVGVRLQPSPPAYLATALWFGMETLAMVWTKVLGDISMEVIRTAIDTANCVAGFQGMATADVSNSAAAGKYLNDAMATVMSCTGRIFESLAKGKILDVVAVGIAQVFSWLWSGVQTLAHGLAAAADTALNFNGYTVTVWYRGQSSPPNNSLPAATQTYSGTAEDAKHSFQYPASWTVTGPAGHVAVRNERGETVANLGILVAWGAECPCTLRPVVNFPSTPGLAPLSRDGEFQVDNVAMDLAAHPDDLSGVRWPKPVQPVTSLSQAPRLSPAERVPSLMYGLGTVETGKVADNGITHRSVIFTSIHHFNTMDQARAYTQTEEHRQIRTMIASFKG